MRRVTFLFAIIVIAFASPSEAFQKRSERYSWTYYRPSNTGIQGDFCEALFVSSDGNPWIAGYDPGFEEGGLAKYHVAQNRWENVSNVDYPVIGHPEMQGTVRIADIAVDANGNLWMATGRGALFYSPSVGPTSLRRFGEDNSPIRGGWNRGVEIAPDGSIWFSAYSTVWGSGGVSQYLPSRNEWRTFDGFGGGTLAIQPRPGSGYYVWTTLGAEVARFDSVADTWKTFPIEDGSPAYLPEKDLTDDAGNTWMYRWTNASMLEYRFDLRRPDGTWVNTPLPPFGNSVEAIRTRGANSALVVDSTGGVWKYSNGVWSSMGSWESTSYSYDVDQDSAGNIWVCGIGGAARRDVVTGVWQRFRVTNTSQYDYFNEDISLDNAGGVYATANAAPGYGGMVKFDGKNWIGYNNFHYGRGIDWPFPTDNSHRVYWRPTTNVLHVNPTFEGLHRHENATWTDLQVGNATVGDMLEDSLGRFWVTYPGKLLLQENGTWKQVSDIGGHRLRKDPNIAGTVWCMGDTTVMATDGRAKLSWSIEDFPELDPQSDQFKGIAVTKDGSVWVGANTINLPDNSSVIKINPVTNTYKMYRRQKGWPFPGQYVMPLNATPDGRMWFQYDSDFGIDDSGLAAFDGVNVIKFPAPFEGRMQWGGLPHAAIMDLEVRPLRDGYQLWMICASRGIAVLRVSRSLFEVGTISK